MTTLGASVRYFAAAFLLLAMIAIARPAAAGSGGVSSLPLPGVKMKNSLRLQVDSRWVDANGYRPIGITVTPMPPGPAPADRQIRVEIRPYDYSGGSGLRAYSKIIEIPQGATTVETTIPIPQDSMWYSLGISVYEGGYKLNDLSVDNLGLPRTNYWNWTEASPAMLVIDADVPVGSQRDMQVAAFKSSGATPIPRTCCRTSATSCESFPRISTRGRWSLKTNQKTAATRSCSRNSTTCRGQPCSRRMNSLRHGWS